MICFESILANAGRACRPELFNLPPYSIPNLAVAGCNSGRARVPARREQVYVINLVKRWSWSVLGFGKTDREDAIPPGGFNFRMSERLSLSPTPVYLSPTDSDR
jgi:hypothetical protein